MHIHVQGSIGKVLSVVLVTTWFTEHVISPSVKFAQVTYMYCKVWVFHKLLSYICELSCESGPTLRSVLCAHHVIVNHKFLLQKFVQL